MSSRHDNPTTSYFRRLAMIACCLLALGLGGCPSYTEEVAAAHNSVISGDVDHAITLINQRLGVESIQEVPATLEDDRALLLLERATILQGQGRFDLSARDMMIVDQRLDWFDIDNTSGKEIGKYLYSDDVADYRAPAYERLLINTMNMINFMANYDLEGARVEARRFLIMESFYVDDQGQPLMPGLLALGNYLAGAAFEASREYDEAARLYSHAWLYGIRDENLRVRLRDLYRISGYSGAGLNSPFFTRLRQEAREAGPLNWGEYQERHQRGDTLIITQYGVVPYKKATRMRADVALRSSSSSGLTPSERAQAASLIASGALTTINFPTLTTDGLPTRHEASATLTIDGQRVGLFQGMDVAQSVTQAWFEIAAPLIAAAIARSITRTVVGQGGRAAGSAAMQSDDAVTAGIGALGWLASLGAEAALGVADTPDTRSWTTLPSHIRLSRIKLPQGLHTAEVRVGARVDRQMLPVWENKLNIMNFSRIR